VGDFRTAVQLCPVSLVSVWRNFGWQATGKTPIFIAFNPTAQSDSKLKPVDFFANGGYFMIVIVGFGIECHNTTVNKTSEIEPSNTEMVVL